ncbi:Phage lysin [Candidatus Burkholderia humilis]|nr:Phage lysin [Candidatus Burkholderia humilis]
MRDFIKTFVGIIVISVCLVPIANSAFGVGQIPIGTFNLQIEGDRPSSPYMSMDNANVDLTATGRGPDYRVTLAWHHIIPYSTLRNFYNSMVERRRLSRFRSFLIVFQSQIPQYAQQVDLSDPCDPRRVNDTNAAVNAVFAMANSGRLMHNSNYSQIPDFNSFAEWYAWIPGNIFIGPDGNHRTDDPGDRFESGAVTIVGQRNFDILSAINNNMTRYINGGGDGLIHDVATGLSSIAQGRSTVYSLTSSQWVRGVDSNNEPMYRIVPMRANNAGFADLENESMASAVCVRELSALRRIRSWYDVPLGVIFLNSMD